MTIFFVLSGFLLYRPVRSRAAARRAGAARRRLRLAARAADRPGVLARADRDRARRPAARHFEPGHAVVYYGFLQIYGDLVLGGITQAWTLCVEVAFYALLPLWALALRRAGRLGRGELSALAGLAALALAWNVVVVLAAADPDHANASRMLIWLPAFLDHFALGMALAVLSVVAERDGRTPRARRVGRAAPVGGVARRARGVHGSSRSASGSRPENRLDAPMTAAQTLARHWLYAAVAVGVLLPAVFGPSGRGRDPAAARAPVAALPRRRSPTASTSGTTPRWRRSWARRPRRDWADFAALSPRRWPARLVAASLSWRLLERPILRLKRLVPDRARRSRDRPRRRIRRRPRRRRALSVRQSAEREQDERGDREPVRADEVARVRGA